MTPLAVVVTCFDHARYLPGAVASALGQDVDGLRVVIVDDGSADDSAEVALALARSDERVSVILQENEGVARARNAGIAATDAELVVCLDADDELMPGFLRAGVEALERNPWAAFAYGDQQNFGGDDRFERHPPYDAQMLRRFNYILATAVMRRSAWEDVGGFADGIGYEDWDFWLTLSEHGHVGVHVPELVLHRRVTSTGRYSGDAARDRETKAGIVLRHPALYGESERAWAEAALHGDENAAAADPGIGVVPKPDRLHVLFTMVGWADEGGGTILPRQIAKALVRHGHRVTVLYAPVEEKPGSPAYHLEASVEDGVRLLALYNRPSRFNDPLHPEREIEDPTVERLVEQVVEELSPDVAHLHSLLGFSMALPRALDAAGVPSVYTSHNYWPICPRMYLFGPDLSLCGGPDEDGGNCAPCLGAAGRADLYAERLRAGRTMLGVHVDRHLAVSRRVRDLFVGAGHDPSRIHVLHQQPETVDALWASVGSRRPLVPTLDRALRVGFIGSLYPHKGAHVLVQALQDFRPGEIEGHLFGGGGERYVDALRELDSAGVVRFHGGYDPGDLPRLLGEVDVVCVPSVWEDCAPLVVAEALAARAPVVASRIGGIPDFVRDGETGFLVAHGDAAALAGSLRRFLENPRLLGRMQAAIEPARGFAAYLDELVRHYRGALDDRRRRTSTIAGARTFAAIAFGDELVADPSLLADYCAAFGDEVDATLVIVGGEPERLAAAAEAGKRSPDLLALVGGELQQARLARGAQALFSRCPAQGALAALPRFADATALRDLAERCLAGSR